MRNLFLAGPTLEVGTDTPSAASTISSAPPLALIRGVDSSSAAAADGGDDDDDGAGCGAGSVGVTTVTSPSVGGDSDSRSLAAAAAATAAAAAAAAAAAEEEEGGDPESDESGGVICLAAAMAAAAATAAAASCSALSRRRRRILDCGVLRSSGCIWQSLVAILYFFLLSKSMLTLEAKICRSRTGKKILSPPSFSMEFVFVGSVEGPLPKAVLGSGESGREGELLVMASLRFPFCTGSSQKSPLRKQSGEKKAKHYVLTSGSSFFFSFWLVFFFFLFLKRELLGDFRWQWL